jgi:hypothetical protein
MPLAGIEPTISVVARPQAHALGRAATGTGEFISYLSKIKQPRTVKKTNTLRGQIIEF